MDFVVNQDILDENTTTSVKNSDLGHGWLHDNGPKHTGTSTEAWFQRNNFTVLKWPSQNPDLNATALDVLSGLTSNHTSKPSNLDDHHKFCDKGWSRIYPER